MNDFHEKVPLGRTDLRVSRLGLGSSYGIGEAGVERAYERGVNFFYWGSLRRGGFASGVRNLAASHRDDLVIVVQSYTRVAGLMRGSLERALRHLETEYADLLLLGWWNTPPPPRIVDAARALVDAGKARHVMISCHRRASFEAYARDPAFGAIMVRYNAAHVGAEQEVFPLLGDDPPGVVAYTATRWGSLLDPSFLPEGERTPTGADCYRFVLSHPRVDLSLSGPANDAELDDALAALDRGPLDEDEMAWMRRVGRAVYVKSRRSLRQRARDFFDGLGGASTGE